jgi:hypothetical protein
MWRGRERRRGEGISEEQVEKWKMELFKDKLEKVRSLTPVLAVML